MRRTLACVLIAGSLMACTDPGSAPAPSASASATAPDVSASASAPMPVASASAAPRAERPTARVPAGDYDIGVRTGNPGLPLSGLPPRRVRVEAFDVDVAEVTADEFLACIREGACGTAQLTDGELCNHGKAGRGAHPINCVARAGAEAFCAWEKKRLPTEIEWEAAAIADGLGGITIALDYSAPLCLTVEYSSSELTRGARPRGTCEAGRPDRTSRLGLLNMMGNVSEWTSSPFCTHAAPECAETVLRGTAWLGDLYEGPRHRFREPGKGGFSTGRRIPEMVGFRCVRTP